MAKVKVPDSSSTSTKKIRPALTPEAREQQLIGLAVDLVQQRLLNGTASSQETTHFLKLGTIKAQAEKKLLEKQVELMDAKIAALKSQERSEELYKKAIAAMKLYGGHGGSEEDYEYDYSDEED